MLGDKSCDDSRITDVGIIAEVERFLFDEAELLDSRAFTDWHALLADDLHYFMPTRYNLHSHEHVKATGGADMLSHFDDDKQSMGIRVRRLMTGRAWAEEPPSRTRHMISNVRVSAGARAGELDVTSYFNAYRNRLGTEVDLFVGKREDVLRRTTGRYGFEIAKRTILLDQATLLAKHISIFF